MSPRLRGVNIHAIALGGIVFAVVLLLFALVWFGRIQIRPSDGVNFEAIVGSKVVQPDTSVRVRPGKYTVTLRNSRIKPVTTSVYVWPFITKKIAPQITALSDEDIVADLLGLNKKEVRIYSLEFFENDQWLVVYADKASDPVGDVGPVIAHFRSNTWTVLGGGTGVDFTEDTGLPRSVRNYLETGIK